MTAADYDTVVLVKLSEVHGVLKDLLIDYEAKQVKKIWGINDNDDDNDDDSSSVDEAEVREI
jgi:hypothetical protein